MNKKEILNVQEETPYKNILVFHEIGCEISVLKHKHEKIMYEIEQKK